MRVEVVKRWESRLPSGDEHPYRTGAWRPNLVEYDATDLEVVEGEVPRDLEGVYLRNTENPLLPSIGRYHPFDGDGMVHAVHFHEGRADYRNRFVRTRGLEAELDAGQPLWAGILEAPSKSQREDGWGARGRMKDASSTDVVVHAGVALTSFYQCGDLYELDPITLAQRGPARWNGAFPEALGVSAHTKVDERTGELLFFNYGKAAPYMHYGVVDASGALVHYVPVPLPGPRLPHDMAFTENFAIVNDFPLFWDPALLAQGVHRARFHPEMPSRFGVLPRRGAPGEVEWFEASATYVLHFVNAWEEGSEIVLDGYHQDSPVPQPAREGEPPSAPFMRSLDLNAMGTRLHRWRFDRATGKTREERLDDAFTEFPTINAQVAGRPHRYVYAMTGEPGWFLFNGIVRRDMVTGERDAWRFPPGVFGSESAMAPRASARRDVEDDGYLVTLVSDVGRDASECQIFHAQSVGRGPIARLRLPERISSGTHACWAPSVPPTRRR